MTEYFPTLSAPPETEPVTLAEALLQCHCESGIEDAWFAARIGAGRQAVESYVNQSLPPQVWVLRVEGIIPAVIELPRSPVIELVDMCYQTGPRYEAAGIDLDKAVLLNGGLPARLLVPDNYVRPGILRIKYKTGYADPAFMPKEFKEAILLYVSHCYENRSGERELPEAFYNLIARHRLFI